MLYTKENLEIKALDYLASFNMTSTMYMKFAELIFDDTLKMHDTILKHSS